ncbi:nitrilase-related carbon-nitrogen hydrolase [Lysinibacillus sp. NPDC058147]|uniref:nitrilase-related carbon-nitrogen hydrolase n=1 Tax=unclassified Lysinibacillus TaxID=2636778 RepID=UPI0036D8F57A
MTIKISSCQFELQKVDNFSTFKDRILHAFNDVPLTSDYVLLPELFTMSLLTTYNNYNQFTEKDYEKLGSFLDDYLEFFNNLSQKRRQIIIAGSTIEPTYKGNYNTTYIFDGEGNVLKHRKTHIFPAESAWNTIEGDEFEVFKIGPVTFGIAICYEIEIPEIAHIYSQKRADIIFCPSYTFSEYGFWRVRHCAHARSIENQLYVVHCPTIGKIQGPIQNGFGTTAIIGPADLPWTKNGVIAETTSKSSTVVTAELSLEDLYENRKNGAATTYKDRIRRKDIYTL